MSTQVQELPRTDGDAVQWRHWDGSAEDPAAAEPEAAHRVWDLRPGDHFHGRTVASVQGVVGLASHPVAVIFFTGPDAGPTGQARIGATESDTGRGHDAVRLLARAWVREQGLHEGQAVDLAELRSAVVAAARRDRGRGR